MRSTSRPPSLIRGPDIASADVAPEFQLNTNEQEVLARTVRLFKEIRGEMATELFPQHPI